MPAVQIDLGWVHATLESQLATLAATLTQGVAYVPPFRGEPLSSDQTKKGRVMGLSMTHDEMGRPDNTHAHAMRFTYEIGLRLAGLSASVSIPFGAVYAAAGVIATGFRTFSAAGSAGSADHVLSCKGATVQVDLRGPQDGSEERQHAVITVVGDVIRCVGSTQTQY